MEEILNIETITLIVLIIGFIAIYEKLKDIEKGNKNKDEEI